VAAAGVPAVAERALWWAGGRASPARARAASPLHAALYHWRSRRALFAPQAASEWALAPARYRSVSAEEGAAYRDIDARWARRKRRYLYYSLLSAGRPPGLPALRRALLFASFRALAEKEGKMAALQWRHESVMKQKVSISQWYLENSTLEEMSGKTVSQL